MGIRDKDFQFLILFGILWAFCVTVSRAIRWPNDWAEAQWLISYEFGFIKRGLAGTLIAPLMRFGDLSGAEFVIKGVSISLFVIFCAVMLWVCFRIVEKSKYSLNGVLLALIFLTSPYVVMSAHLNGYFDNIIVIISVLSCLILMRGKMWLASIAISVGMLVHETIFFVGFPTFLFLALIKYVKEEGASNIPQLAVGFITRYSVLLMVPSITFLAIVTNQILLVDSVVLKSQLINHISEYGFVRENRNIIVPTAFTTSFLQYLNTESKFFFQRITYPVYLVNAGLPLLVLLVYGWHILRGFLFHRTLFSLLVLVALLPLSLHLIAWDSSRIWLYPIVAVVIGLWGINEVAAGDNKSQYDGIFFSFLGTMIVVFQIFIVTPLMDGERERMRDVTRILYYLPTLILFAMFAAKNNFLVRVCNEGGEKRLAEKKGESVARDGIFYGD